MDNKDKKLILESVNWEKLRNKTIFLTGASGFIGSWFIKCFIYANKELKLNARLIASSRSINKLESIVDYSCMTLFKWDITDNKEGIDLWIQRCDYVIHAACNSDNKFAQENTIDLLDLCYYGTSNILKNCLGQKKDGILYLSSGAAEYNTIYGNAKRIGELVCDSYYKKYQLPIKTARIYSVMGPNMNLNGGFAITNFIKDRLENKQSSAAMNVVRSYMYSVDLIIWLFNILLEGENGKTYNVGSEKSVSVFEVGRLINSNCRWFFDNSDSSNSGAIYVPNVSSIKLELGLKENYELKEMVAKTLESYIKS